MKNYKKSAVHTMIYMLARAKAKHFDLMLESASIDVSARQFYLLRYIFRNNGCTQREISTDLCKDKTLITRMLGTLSRKEILERRMDGEDGRIKRIFLTPKGEKLRDELLQLYCRHEHDTIDGLSLAEIEQFIITSKKMIKNCLSETEYDKIEKKLFCNITTDLSELGC